MKKYTTGLPPQLNTTIKVAAGEHHFSVFAVNAAGEKWSNAVSATVE